MFSLTLQDGGFAERLAASRAILEKETTNWLVDIAQWAKADLKKRVPVKTGTLRNSIRYELNHSSDGGEATFHSAFYGPILDEGTKPFTITARSGKPMAFYRGADQVFANTVKHPGIQARNFTLDTLEASETEAGRQAERIGDSILGRVIG